MLLLVYLSITIWVTPGNQLVKASTSPLVCFTTGFPGAPQGSPLPLFPNGANAVHRCGAIFTARSQKGFLTTVFLPMRTFVCRYGLDVKRDAAICTGGTKCFDQDRALTEAPGSAVSGEWIKGAVPDRLVSEYEYCATKSCS
jgi:hypothetical protein